MKKICLLLIIACFCSCGYVSEEEKKEKERIEKERIEKERIKKDSLDFVRFEREFDSINKIEKQNEISRLYASGKGLDAMLLDDRITIDQYNALKKIDESNVKLNTGPTILDEVMDKYERNLHTDPHLTH